MLTQIPGASGAKEADRRTNREALRTGQLRGMFPNLTVAENVLVGREGPRTGRPRLGLADAGVIPPIDLDPYYKDEVILGFEWQFSRNWAFDAKGIYWELGDMVMNTVQREPNNTTFLLSSNDFNFRDNLRALGVVPDHLIDGFEDPFKEYTALQLQVNKRFANGWALFNNLTWAKLETTGSGAWWDNSSSAYGEDLGQVLTQGTIDACANFQLGLNADGTAPGGGAQARAAPEPLGVRLGGAGRRGAHVGRGGRRGVGVVGPLARRGRLDGGPGHGGQQVAAVGLVADRPAGVDVDVVHGGALVVGAAQQHRRGPVEVVGRGVGGVVVAAHERRR